MIYFDNAATIGQRPYSVINSVTNAILNLSANPGRSGHALSLECGKMVTRTRSKLSTFFGGTSLSRVIFTKNCSEALNIAILGSVKDGGHVITTANEHNSVLRPLYELEKAGMIHLTVLYPSEEGVVTPTDIENAINRDTYLVAISHASNVTGATCDISSIGELTRKKGLLLLVDAAQSAGHIMIDCMASNIDMLAFAGHKGLYAIQGSGGLIFSDRVSLKPILFGGTGTDSESLYQPTYSPEGFESGTLSTPAIASLDAGLEYLSSHFIKNKQALQDICNYLHSYISTLPHLRILSKQNECGIISVLHSSLPSQSIAQILSDKYSIAVRSGLHCAPLIHKHLKTMEIGGLTRISASCFNTRQDCDKLLSALKNTK